MSGEQRPGWSGIKSLLWLGLIIVLAAGLSLISIHIPMGRDQGVAAYFGWQTLLGKVVYRDLYHFNFPGIFWTYAAAFRIFGLRTEAINYFDTSFRLFTLAGVYMAGSRIFTRRTGVWAAGIYGLFSTVAYNDYWLNAQKETFALGPLVFCLYFFARGLGEDRIRKPSIFFAGVFSFWAMLYKPTVALAPGLAVLYMLFQKRYEPKDRMLGLFSFAPGFLIPASAVVIYFYSQAALLDMARQVFIFGISYGSQYYKGGVKVWALLIWKVLFWAVGFGLVTSAALLAAVWSARAKDKGIWLLFWFGLGLFLNIIVQLKFFVYHFMVLLLPLSILAAQFFGEHLRGVLSGQGRAAKTAVWMFAGFLVAADLTADLSRYGRELLYDFGRISREDFLERYGRWGFGDISAVASYKVARYLREQTEPSDKVLVFGIEPGLNFLSKRESATRFCYDLPLTYQYGGKGFERHQAGLRKEFVDELRESRPVYIVVIENDTNTVEPKDSFGQMLEFVEFRSFLDQNYYLETKIEHYYLYRRK